MERELESQIANPSDEWEITPQRLLRWLCDAVMDRLDEGFVHVGSMAAKVRPVPGSGTAEGQRAILEITDQALDTVRASIASRASIE